MEISYEQVRRFRLHRHHLDGWCNLHSAAAACGLQNSPPGAWELAAYNRVAGCTPQMLRDALVSEKTLLQAWSVRGAPRVFPTSDSALFLAALCAAPGEEWLYTRGIGLALDFLQMEFAPLLALLRQKAALLDSRTIAGKSDLDETLAAAMSPALPAQKRALWGAPSMYGGGARQTVGGAVVSFLLRPCACLGLVVFGRRDGTTPQFTSYQSWLGKPMEQRTDAVSELVRRFLRCYAPARPAMLQSWLGCTPGQTKRMWDTVAAELTPVTVAGQRRYVLSADLPLLCDPPTPTRTLHLLGGDDPYVEIYDRAAILPDKARQRQLWQTVANPGAVLWQGQVAGLWRAMRCNGRLTLRMTLWQETDGSALRAQAEQYAAFCGLALQAIEQ